MTDHALHLLIASQVAHTYHRRCPWIEEADYLSHAWEGMLDVTSEERAYLYSCAMRACYRAAWAHRDPALKRGNAQPHVTLHDLTDDPSASDVSPEDALMAEQSHAFIRARFEHALTKGLHADVARAVLLEEQPAAAVAEQTALPVKRVYKISELARRRIANDPELKRFCRAS